MDTNKLNGLLKSIKQQFTLSKKIDFDEMGISITIETITTLEELKVLEAIKDFEGGSYMEALKKSSLAYAIKKINDITFDEDLVEYDGDDGKPVKESKYLFLLHQIEGWPSAIRDVLIVAFNNLNLELESKVNQNVKFEVFTVQPEPETAKIHKDVNAPEGFKVLEKVEEPEGELTETEKINKQVEKELEQAQMGINLKTDERVESHGNS
jgi:hypothetical protein